VEDWAILGASVPQGEKGGESFKFAEEKGPTERSKRSGAPGDKTPFKTRHDFKKETGNHGNVIWA
jgi:hypothetical protein